MNSTQHMAADGTIYTETFTARDQSTGTLAVRCLKRDGSQYALIGYLPAGMDIGPHVFCRGSLDACRGAYKAAKATMLKWFPKN